MTLFAVFGWFTAFICALGWRWTLADARKGANREAYYQALIAEQQAIIQPSLAALKHARTIAPLLILLLLPSLSHAQTTPILFGALADAASTEYAVRHADVREGNPIMGQSTAQRIVVKSIGTLASVYMVKRIGRDHPTLAKVAGYTIGGTLSVIAAHNLRVAERARR